MADNNIDVFKMFAAEDRLDGDNHPMWAYMMQHVLVSKGVWNIVQGIDVRPGSLDVAEVVDVAGPSTRIAAGRPVLPTAEQARWDVKDAQAHALIALSVKRTITPHIRSTKSTKQAWDILAGLYAGRNEAKIALLRKELESKIMNEEDDMDTFLADIKDINEQLISVGEIISDSSLPASKRQKKILNATVYGHLSTRTKEEKGPFQFDLCTEAKIAAEENAQHCVGKPTHPFFLQHKGGQRASTFVGLAANDCLPQPASSFEEVDLIPSPPFHVTQFGEAGVHTKNLDRWTPLRVCQNLKMNSSTFKNESLDRNRKDLDSLLRISLGNKPSKAPRHRDYTSKRLPHDHDLEPLLTFLKDFHDNSEENLDHEKIDFSLAYLEERMDGYREEGSSSQDRQHIPIVHEVGEGSSQAEETFRPVFGGMHDMLSNPMYADIGLQPGFQGTQDCLFDNLKSMDKPKPYEESGQSVQFDTFSGFDERIKGFSFLEQFDKVFTRRNFTEASKVRKAASFLKRNASQWWNTLSRAINWLKLLLSKRGKRCSEVTSDIISVCTDEGRAQKNMLWTDLYQPQSPKEVCGNRDSVNVLHAWLEKWHPGSPFVMGPPERGSARKKISRNEDSDGDHCCFQLESDSEGSTRAASSQNVLFLAGPIGVWL
ncbi:hypothetical protein L7F22_048803 [Adiantum nelumboides]|nr:hypothetical protein [Adiantum nelumboides]